MRQFNLDSSDLTRKHGMVTMYGDNLVTDYMILEIVS